MNLLLNLKSNYVQDNLLQFNKVSTICLFCDWQKIYYYFIVLILIL